MKESEKLKTIGASTELVEQMIQREAEETEPGAFVIYTEGLCFASVCSSLPQNEVEAKMRRVPSGTNSGWKFAHDHPTFSSGESNPCPCNEHPLTHKHFLFAC